MKHCTGATALILLIFNIHAQAQVLTPEDSLNAGLVRKEQPTVISGYGEAKYSYDSKRRTAEANLERVVLFVGHRFSSKISLFTEMEIEDALVAGGEEGEGGKGEISMEQAFIKFNISPTHYLVAGLFVPRLGFINENHLPTTFNGVDRPYLEQLVIPSTWRELGIGWYGSIRNLPGLNFSLALTNGLNGQAFENGTGIRNGRQMGSKASGLNLGLSGSLLYYSGHYRLQASAYVGGTTALEKKLADSLQLNNGPFGNPVSMGEINAQYADRGWNMRVIVTYIDIAGAAAINKAFSSNTPSSIYGAYAELAYDVLEHRYAGQKSLDFFGRYEFMDLSAKIPHNGVANDANRQQYIVGGITYKPIRGVAVKADYVRRITGQPNPDILTEQPYYKSNGFINLGIAYNF